MSDSRRTVNDFLFINFPRLFLSFFPKNVFCGALLAALIFPSTPFRPPVFFALFIPGSTPPVRSVFHHPRSFIFSLPLLLSAGPLTNPLGSVPSRILWEVSSRESFGKSPLTNPLGNPLSRTLWEISSHGSFGKRPLTNPLAIYSHSGHGVVFPLFFEPSRASEARRRRQEAREGVPKRTGACERGGEARRRKPWWEVNDHLPNNR